MTAPVANFRIVNEAGDGFADTTSYASKELAEAAAAELITAKGSSGPSKLWIFALASDVVVDTKVEDVAT